MASASCRPFQMGKYSFRKARATGCIVYNTSALNHLYHFFITLALVYREYLDSPSRTWDKYCGSPLPSRSHSYCSSRHVASHKSILLVVIGDGLSSIYFWSSGSVKSEMSCPGGSILSSFSTKSFTLSMPSRVTEICGIASVFFHVLGTCVTYLGGMEGMDIWDSHYFARSRTSPHDFEPVMYVQTGVARSNASILNGSYPCTPLGIRFLYN